MFFFLFSNFLPGSAICAFKLSLIQSSLSGPFLVNRDLSENILNHVIPASKHPGNCQRENLKDDDLVFLKNHPQLKQQVIDLSAQSLISTKQNIVLFALVFCVTLYLTCYVNVSSDVWFAASDQSRPALDSGCC